MNDRDFLGNQINIGDKVIFEAPRYRDFVIGTVISKAEKTCQIEYINDWNYASKKLVVRQFYGQIIKYAALQEREERSNMNQWISVEDRLPEDDPDIGKHIESNKFGFLTVLVYNGVVKQTNRFFCDAPRFGLPKTNGWVWASSNVTHWMPLPNPPEEEQP